MHSDKRRAARRPMRYTAWIAQPGKELLGCTVADISDTGARVNLDDPASFPDDFILCLSSRGWPRRKCKVAWRSKTQLGVRFEFPLSAKNKSAAVMNMLATQRAREVKLAMAARATAPNLEPVEES